MSNPYISLIKLTQSKMESKHSQYGTQTHSKLSKAEAVKNSPGIGEAFDFRVKDMVSVFDDEFDLSQADIDTKRQADFKPKKRYSHDGFQRLGSKGGDLK